MSNKLKQILHFFDPNKSTEISIVDEFYNSLNSSLKSNKKCLVYPLAHMSFEDFKLIYEGLKVLGFHPQLTSNSQRDEFLSLDFSKYYGPTEITSQMRIIATPKQESSSKKTNSVVPSSVTIPTVIVPTKLKNVSTENSNNVIDFKKFKERKQSRR
jgi:hypothetical protein